jgi:hypothetical protein
MLESLSALSLAAAYHLICNFCDSASVYCNGSAGDGSLAVKIEG